MNSQPPLYQANVFIIKACLTSRFTIDGEILVTETDYMGLGTCKNHSIKWAEGEGVPFLSSWDEH